MGAVKKSHEYNILLISIIFDRSGGAETGNEKYCVFLFLKKSHVAKTAWNLSVTNIAKLQYIVDGIGVFFSHIETKLALLSAGKCYIRTLERDGGFLIIRKITNL